MIIELEEYKLPEGKRLHDKDAYTKTGLFLVNDGITSSLVSIPKIGESPFFIPVPLNMITQHIRHKSAKETESDIGAKLIGRLESISSKIDELFEINQMESVPQIYHEEKIDGSTLLKAIALVQNPDLAEKLLSE